MEKVIIYLVFFWASEHIKRLYLIMFFSFEKKSLIMNHKYLFR